MGDKYWEEDAVQAAPAYTLAECAALDVKWFDEEDLTDIPSLIEKTKERFRSALFVCDKEQLGFLRDAADMSAEKTPFTEMPPGGFYSFFCNNFVFLFFWEDEYYLVLPDELADIYRGVLSEPDFAAVSGYNQELCAYANALINLYGACEINWYVEVWNNHHREKITLDGARGVLSDLEEFYPNFWLDDGFIINESLFDDDFEELLEMVGDMDYYMPSKSVIAIYSEPNESYYEKTSGAKEMNAFLAGIIDNEVKLDNLQLEVALSCERLERPEYVRGCLERAEFPLGDAEVSAKFEKLYQNLRDNTHIWELRGFTPYQYEIETGKRLKRFALPMAEPKPEPKSAKQGKKKK